MGKKNKKQKAQPQQAQAFIIPTAHDMGNGEVRHTVPAQGFQRLVSITRDGIPVWVHANLTALLTP